MVFGAVASSIHLISGGLVMAGVSSHTVMVSIGSLGMIVLVIGRANGGSRMLMASGVSGCAASRECGINVPLDKASVV